MQKEANVVELTMWALRIGSIHLIEAGLPDHEKIGVKTLADGRCEEALGEARAGHEQSTRAQHVALWCPVN